jgi:phosphodiesterase/alkaline phosphatase D-like protein
LPPVPIALRWEVAEYEALARRLATGVVPARPENAHTVHVAHSWVLTWDEHEVENDYAGKRACGGLSLQAFLVRRTAAYKAQFEHLPVSPAMAPFASAMRIHDRFAWGRQADLGTLDARQFRGGQVCGDGRAGGRILRDCEALRDEPRTVSGAAPEQWLAQGMAGSTARWKLLGLGSQLSPCGIDSPLGRQVFSDGWAGYPRARERLLSAMSRPGMGNVVNLGGDAHRHVAARLRLRPYDTRAPAVAREFVCNSTTTSGASGAVTALMRSSGPDLLHARSDERGYALIEVERDSLGCEFRATPSPALAGAALTRQARFVAETGRPGPLADCDAQRYKVTICAATTPLIGACAHRDEAQTANIEAVASVLRRESRNGQGIRFVLVAQHRLRRAQASCARERLCRHGHRFRPRREHGRPRASRGRAERCRFVAGVASRGARLAHEPTPLNHQWRAGFGDSPLSAMRSGLITLARPP